jgi:hypothetical protein
LDTDKPCHPNWLQYSCNNFVKNSLTLEMI